MELKPEIPLNERMTSELVFLSKRLETPTDSSYFEEFCRRLASLNMSKEIITDTWADEYKRLVTLSTRCHRDNSEFRRDKWATERRWFKKDWWINHYQNVHMSVNELTLSELIYYYNYGAQHRGIEVHFFHNTYDPEKPVPKLDKSNFPINVSHWVEALEEQHDRGEISVKSLEFRKRVIMAGIQNDLSIYYINCCKDFYQRIMKFGWNSDQGSLFTLNEKLFIGKHPYPNMPNPWTKYSTKPELIFADTTVGIWNDEY